MVGLAMLDPPYGRKSAYATCEFGCADRVAVESKSTELIVGDSSSIIGSGSGEIASSIASS
jgi:hypothetical protein